jgi:hypothetical protein
MAGENKNGMQCLEFDALLSEVLDGNLKGPKLESFQLHAASCAVCGPLLADAKAGLHWMESLEEIEPPSDLVRNILLATTGVRPSWWERFQSAFLTPMVNLARQPRFAMSFGMAFFSLSVTLSIAGVRLGDLRHLDLRPSAIKRTYYQTTAKAVKYYENIRFVYEVESRVREFKRATTPEQNSDEKDKNRKNDTSGQPDQKQERNYSQGDSQPVLASAPTLPPVVTVTTYRRLYELRHA